MLLYGLLLIAAATAARPNIVWIMSDDLGWGEVGLYPAGSSHGRLSTPHLDQFGKEGLRFTNAYAGYTVCAPSRTTFFTGWHSGNFIKHGLPGTSLPVKDNVTTTAAMLKAAGYKTGAFGKTAPLDSPTEQGFDIFEGQLSQAYCHNMYPTIIDYSPPVGSTRNMTMNYNQKSRELCMANPSAYNYSIDIFQSSALSWLDQVAGGSDPFFLYLSFTIPHAGGWGSRPSAPEQGQPVPTDSQYSNKEWPDVEKDHAAVVEYLDNQVGEVVSKLKSYGIDENTIVFFASDNGAHNEGGHSHTFFNSTGGLRGFKRSLYEGGVRSPSMVRWPGTITPGVSDIHWAFWDVMPTLADIVGTKVPRNDIDGVSFAATLHGKTQPPREYLYHTWGGGKHSGYGVRIGDWKGVVTACGSDYKPSKGDTMELYDLTVDPFETNDVSGAHKDQVEKMKQIVLGKDLTCHCYQC